jgi:hypothetical protein
VKGKTIKEIVGDLKMSRNTVRNLADQRYYGDKFDLTSFGFIRGVMGTPRTVGAEINLHY